MAQKSGLAHSVPQGFDLLASRAQKPIAEMSSDLSSEKLSFTPSTASPRTVTGHVTCEASGTSKVSSAAVTNRQPAEAVVALTTSSLVTVDMTNFEVINGLSSQSPSAPRPDTHFPEGPGPSFRSCTGSQSALHREGLSSCGPRSTRRDLQATEQEASEFAKSAHTASSSLDTGLSREESAPTEGGQGACEKEVPIKYRGTEDEDFDKKKEVGFFRDRRPPAGYFVSGDATGYPWLTWSSVVHPDQPELQPTSQQKLAAAQDPNFILHLLLDVGHLVGQGQYGKVYAAVLRKSVSKTGLCRLALKKMAKGDPETAVHAMAEQRALTIGRACPFLVHLISCFQTKLAFYLLMELAEGGPLTDVLNRFGRLPEVNVRFYAAQIFLGVSFLHDHNILHRDLKLDNVLVDGDGYIRLCDFGLSMDNVRDDDAVGSPCGTFFYMAPEVFRCSYGKAADWWSYGVLVYLLATGKLPFHGRNIKELVVSITCREPAYDCFLGSALVSFLKKLLKKSERARPGHESSANVSTLARDPFFADVDWDRLHRRSLTPPSLPQYRLQFSGPEESSSPALRSPLSASYPIQQHRSSLECDRQTRKTRSRSLDVIPLIPALYK